MYTKYLKNNKKIPVVYSHLGINLNKLTDEFVLLFSSTSTTIHLFYRNYDSIHRYKNYKSIIFKSNFLNEKYSNDYFEKKDNFHLDMDIYPFLIFFNVNLLKLDFEQNEEVLEKIYFIKDKLKYQREKYWPCLVKSSLYELLSKLTSFYFDKQYKYGKYEFDVVEVKKYMEKSYFEEINIKILCEKFFVNRDKLQKSFKNRFGETPINYLNKIRIKKAKVLLRESKLPISLIIEKIGFNSISNFNRKFKLEEHINPREYRNQG